MSSRSVPPASAVARGVWSIPLPFPNPLGYTITYSLRVDGGMLLVDLGWDSDESWDALVRGLRQAGGEISDVLGAVITHIHPDHFGLAERLADHSTAWIATHAAERTHVAADAQAREAFLSSMHQWLIGCGCPTSELLALANDADEVRSRLASKMPDVVLEDNDEVPGTNGSLVVLHTPGHTPGHLCLVDLDRRLLFTGDHVLPRVTPNVSWRPDVDPDPLSDFMASLRRLRWYGDYLVLPGHEWAFDNLTTRLDELERHHVERLDEVRTVVAAGARTTWDVTTAVSWRRPFSSLESRARRSALGETGSHLIRLAALGLLVADPNSPTTWSISRRS